MEPIKSGHYYHIFNRGNNGENIFIEEKNYSYFLKLMKRHVHPVADIFVYCLLRNHFHWLVRTRLEIEEAKISQGFSNFFNAYAKSINKLYERKGSLFQTPFSRKSISNEEYLRKVIMYIHLNPKIHGFTNDFANYPYSSYVSIISDKNTNLKRDEVLAVFDDKENFIYTHRNRQSILNSLEKEFLLE